MGNIAKDPDFPLQHVQITELKNTTKMAEQVKESDILITRNGETVAYLVNPSHYEALVTHWNQTHTLTLAERFLRGYEQTHGTLERLDEAYAAAEQSEWATEDEVAEVFGD